MADSSVIKAWTVREWVKESPYEVDWVTSGERVRVTVTDDTVTVTGQNINTVNRAQVQGAFRRAVTQAYRYGCGTPGCYNGADQPTDSSAVLRYDGVDRAYTYFKPKAGPTPLVVAMHGALGNAVGLEREAGFRPLAAVFGWSILYPEAIYTIWDLTTDPPYVEALLHSVAAASCLNAAHIYVTGFSMGAMMASILGCTTSDFAAAAPVAGLTWANARRSCRTGTALLGWHGDADPVVPLDGAEQGNLNLLLPSWASAADRVAVATSWAHENGCLDTPLQVDENADTLHRWSCPSTTAAAFHVAHGLAHTWPAGATLEMWMFFAGQSREDVAPRRALGS